MADRGRGTRSRDARAIAHFGSTPAASGTSATASARVWVTAAVGHRHNPLQPTVQTLRGQGTLRPRKDTQPPVRVVSQMATGSREESQATRVWRRACGSSPAILKPPACPRRGSAARQHLHAGGLDRRRPSMVRHGKPELVRHDAGRENACQAATSSGPALHATQRSDRIARKNKVARAGQRAES